MWKEEWGLLFFSVGGCFRRIHSEEGMVEGGGVGMFLVRQSTEIDRGLGFAVRWR